MSASKHVVVVELEDELAAHELAHELRVRSEHVGGRVVRGPLRLQAKAVEMIELLDGVRLNFLVLAELRRRLKKLVKET